MLEALDAWLIARFESLTHWTQRAFGIASASWRRLFLCLALAQVVGGEIPRHWKLGPAFPLWDGVLVGFLLAHFAASLMVDNDQASAEATMNPEKLRGYLPRLMWFIAGLVFIPMDIESHQTLWYQCTAISMYFAACDDLPPGLSKVRRFIQRAAAALSLRPQET